MSNAIPVTTARKIKTVQNIFVGSTLRHIHVSYMKKVYKEMRFKKPKSEDNVKEITRLKLQNSPFLRVIRNRY